MKKVILLIAFVLIVSVGFAGPFGLEMGMTLDEIKEKCGSSNVEYVGNDIYGIKPPKPSPFLCTYAVYTVDTVGLYRIVGIGVLKPYADCLIDLGVLANFIERFYGKPQRVTKLKDSTPKYMNFAPDTIIEYRWELPQCKKLEKEKIAYVIVNITEGDEYVGVVQVRYTFNNYKKAEENATPF